MSNEICNKDFVFLSPDGAFHMLEMREKYLCTMEQFLATTANRIPVKLKNVMQVGSSQVDLSIVGNQAFVTLRPSGFFFNTWFRVSPERKRLEAVLLQQADSQMVRLLWTPPESMKLRFGMVCQDQGGLWAFLEAYLLATTPDNKKWFKLPLPNIHPNGKICMGNGFRPPQSPLDVLVNGAWSHFNASPWQTDINPGLDKVASVFAFDVATQKPIHNGDWTKHCEPVNMAIFDHFV